MIEPTFLSVPELAERWGASSRQILEHGISRALPILFAFEGLAFDQADRWLMSHGAHDEAMELEAKTKSVASSEAHLRRNAAGNVDEFSRMDQDEVVALRQSINADHNRIRELSDRLEQRDRARLDYRFMGYMRAPPRVLWELMQNDDTPFPHLAFHPISDVQLVNIDGRTVWEGRMMTLEPDITGAWKGRLRVSDLLIPWTSAKALEAAQKSFQGEADSPPSTSDHDATKPVPRMKAQAAAILAEISRLGHDPKALPLGSPGKPGVRAQVSNVMKEQRPDLFTTSSFKRAWEDLRSSGEIADGKSATQ
ncbi:hypothetical protein [Pseudomonas sp. PD9R]|uniref:hypothetical protein n=1 Tax=Pseudomonas sp. PD9R TaxID=2853534 RepID=UPI001C45CC7D|nr:hypothetical protein [Pseudomonas sp. PD9R]MBV6823867.1 hypothetical protein [Pseudomonas sp. PD9R]